MSNGAVGDRGSTRDQMQTLADTVGDRNWLRHRVGSQAALIDNMLLGNGNTLDQIAQGLCKEFKNDYPDRQPSDWTPRIRAHLRHLRGRVDSDSTGQKPHGLTVVEDGDKRLRFGIPDTRTPGG